MSAATLGHYECISYIVKGIEHRPDELSENLLDTVSKKGKTALGLAAKYRHFECVELLIKRGACVNIPEEYPPILEAAKVGDVKCVEVLLEGGANLDLECTTVRVLIETAEREDQAVCADVLRRTGGEVDAQITTGEAVLYCVVANSFVPCLASLVSAGISVNAGFTSYVTPLMVAAAAGSRGLACLKMLLTVGANINEVNKYGMNALNLSIACSKDTVRDREKCKLLHAAGERIAVDSGGDTFTCVGTKTTYTIPEYLQFNDLRLSLKHICRQALREYLIDLTPHSHLFERIPELRLPSQITRYLLYGMSLA